MHVTALDERAPITARPTEIHPQYRVTLAGQQARLGIEGRDVDDLVWAAVGHHHHWQIVGRPPRRQGQYALQRQSVAGGEGDFAAGGKRCFIRQTVAAARDQHRSIGGAVEQVEGTGVAVADRLDDRAVAVPGRAGHRHHLAGKRQHDPLHRGRVRMACVPDDRGRSGGLVVGAQRNFAIEGKDRP